MEMKYEETKGITKFIFKFIIISMQKNKQTGTHSVDERLFCQGTVYLKDYSGKNLKYCLNGRKN